MLTNGIVEFEFALIREQEDSEAGELFPATCEMKYRVLRVRHGGAQTGQSVTRRVDDGT